MKTRRIVNPILYGLLLLGCICLLPSAPLWAQEPAMQPRDEIREDFSENELKTFVRVNQKISAIQTEAEQNMIKAIEGEGLTIDRFNEILEQQRDPERGNETPDEELRSFNNAAQMILEENAKIEKQMATAIEAEGMDLKTFKQILIAYQQNPEIKNRINNLVHRQK